MVVARLIKVEVVYAASAQQQALIDLSVPDNATVQAAIQQSGLLVRFPELDLAINKIGVFGKQVALDHLLRPGDRVEIYRPLVMDPMQARKLRAQRQRQKKPRTKKDVAWVGRTNF